MVLPIIYYIVVFNDVLETAKIHLRVGGEAGLLVVKGRLRPPSDEIEDDDG